MIVLKTAPGVPFMIEGHRGVEYRLILNPQGLQMLLRELTSMAVQYEQEGKSRRQMISWIGKEGPHFRFSVLLHPDAEEDAC